MTSSTRLLLELMQVAGGRAVLALLELSLVAQLVRLFVVFAGFHVRVGISGADSADNRTNASIDKWGEVLYD